MTTPTTTAAIKTDALRFALKLAQPCIVTVDFIPILQHFCFEPERLFAYDEVSAIAVGFETGLHCGVRAAPFMQLVELAGADLKLAMNGATLKFASGSHVAELPILPAAQFLFEAPRLRDRSTVQFRMTEEAMTGLRLCMESVGQDPHTPEQTAVLIRTGSPSALYASDGTSMLRVALSKPLSDTERTALIPQSICAQILGLATALSCTPENVTVNLSEKHLVVDFTQDKASIKQIGSWEVRLYGKLLTAEVDIAAYDDTVEKAYGNTVIAVDEAFSAAVDRVAVVVRNDVERHCLLVVDKAGLTIKGKGGFGTATTTLEGVKGNTTADLAPDRLTRYRDHVTHIVIDQSHVAMYDSAKPKKAKVTYITACYD